MTVPMSMMLLLACEEALKPCIGVSIVESVSSLKK